MQNILRIIVKLSQSKQLRYMNIKRAQVHDRSFRVNLKKKNIFVYFFNNIIFDYYSKSTL